MNTFAVKVSKVLCFGENVCKEVGIVRYHINKLQCNSLQGGL
ncbi:hypothetical protein [Clostridium perfringens]